MSDAINQVNELEIKALWSYLDRLSKRVEVLERENREQWDFIIALSNDVARHNIIIADDHMPRLVNGTWTNPNTLSPYITTSNTEEIKR